MKNNETTLPSSQSKHKPCDDTETEHEILIDFTGPMTIETIAFWGKKIKALELEFIFNRNKLFKAYIELSQNISYYSVERKMVNYSQNVGIGKIRIIKCSKGYVLLSSNKVFTHHCIKIKEYFNELSQLSSEEIRKLKSEKLKTANDSNPSAHIGFLYIALLCNKKVNCDFIQIDKFTSEMMIYAII